MGLTALSVDIRITLDKFNSSAALHIENVVRILFSIPWRGFFQLRVRAYKQQHDKQHQFDISLNKNLIKLKSFTSASFTEIFK